MTISWWDFVTFVRQQLLALYQTRFDQVHYENSGLARDLMIVVLVAAGLTLARTIWGRHRHSRFHSGYFIKHEYRKRIWVRLLYGLPKLGLAAALVLLLAAIADPFLVSTEEYAGSMDSRVRVDVVDVSGSMGWEFPGTRKSKAEVARDAHLKFLEMRRGKHDRVSLWLFSTYPYMVDDFVTDDELYYFQTWDAPYVMSQAIERAMVVPRDKVRIIPAEGDSNIVRPLQAIIKQLDQDEVSSGRRGRQQRAVLVISDAAVSEFPQNELVELNERDIVPYIIYINASDPRFAIVGQHQVPALIEQIRSYRGDYFDVTDPRSLSRAFEAIDSREAVRYEIRHRALKMPIHTRFVVAGLALLLVTIPAGLIAELFWGTVP